MADSEKFNRRSVLKSAGAAFAATAAADSANAEEPTREYNPISAEREAEITAEYKDLSTAAATVESTGDLVLEELADRDLIDSPNADALDMNGVTEEPKGLENVQVTTYYDEDDDVGRVKLTTGLLKDNTEVAIFVKPEEDMAAALVGDRDTPKKDNELIVQYDDELTFPDYAKSCLDYCQPCPWVGKRNEHIKAVDLNNPNNQIGEGCGCVDVDEALDAVRYCCKDSCCKALCWG